MSNDALNEFVGNLNTDESLREALQERFGDLSGDIAADDLIAFAGQHGYTFDVEEAEEELAEDQLEGVAGGLGPVFPKVEIDVTAAASNFEEIKVTYVPLRRSFNFFKI